MRFCDGRGGFFPLRPFWFVDLSRGLWCDSGRILFDSGAESVGKWGLVVDKGC